MFYGKRQTVVPADPAISEEESSEEEDDDVADFVPPTHNLETQGLSDMGPSAKKGRCVWPAVEVVEEEKDEEQPAPQANRSTTNRKPAARKTTWKKIDLDEPAPVLCLNAFNERSFKNSFIFCANVN